MPFDINALIQNPQFQSGMALFGASSQRNRGMLEALQFMQATRKQQAEEEERKQMAQYRQAQIEVARQNALKYGQQTELAAQEAVRKQAARERNQKILERFLPPESPNLQAPAAIPEQPAPIQPAASVGKYGTPTAILDNLLKVESGGNPLALGPVIGHKNGKPIRAEGAYQFLPDTTDMLRAQGLKFDPFKPLEARDAADFYIQNLVKEHGDYPKAMAAYGGFKTKDASSYVSKVLSGSPEQQAAQQLQRQNIAQLGQKNQQTFGAFAPEFKLGGEGDIDITLKPRDLEEAARRNEELRLKQAENVRQEQELGLRKQAATQVAQEKTLKAAETKAKDRAAFDTVHSSAVSAERLTNELLKNPSFDQIFGRTGGLISPRLLSGDAMNAAASLETLKAKMLNDTLQAIRQSSINGASGYGQLDKTEGENLRQLVATLERAQTPEHARKSLVEIQKHLRKVSARSQDVYEETYKEGAFKGKPVGTRIKRFGTLNGRTVIEYSSGEVEYAD